MSDIYRQAASVLLLRREPQIGTYQMLLLHKPRKRDAWQLPQGGVEEGESTEQAAMRELQEEAGLSGPRVLCASEQVYRYDFPPSYRRFRPDNVKGQHIRFIAAFMENDAPVLVDGKEVDGFVWVDTETIKSYIKRKEYLSLVMALYEDAIALLSKEEGN